MYWDEPILDEQWLERMDEMGLKCPGCTEVTLSRMGDKVDVDLVDVPKSNMIDYPVPLVSVFRTELYGCIEHELPPHVLGKCFLIYEDDSRDNLENYVSCYLLSGHRITFRDAAGSKYDVCKICGRASLQYGPGRSYILRREIGNYQASLAEGNGAVLLADDLKTRIDWSQFPDADVIGYPILEEPIDGVVLPCDKGRKY